MRYKVLRILRQTVDSFCKKKIATKIRKLNRSSNLNKFFCISVPKQQFADHIKHRAGINSAPATPVQSKSSNDL